MRKPRISAAPQDPWAASDPALALALQQVDYYSRNSNRFRKLYRGSELLILLATATTTVVAALNASAWVTATLAASTVVLTGMNRIVDTHDRYVASITAWAEMQTDGRQRLPAPARGPA